LIDAYALYVKRSKAKDQVPISLVFVGSGEDEERLEKHAKSLGLAIIDCRNNSINPVDGITFESSHAKYHLDCHGAVYFYGFRQAQENTVFYAFADAFVLPSTIEEWGLVVNEAMASSLPIIASKTAGCVEDLLVGHSLNHNSFHKFCECDNGFVFDPFSREGLCNAIFRIAEADSEELVKKGKESLHIISHFSCSNFARKACAAEFKACQ
jgi:glycosyltransferase involved in cell wall biosynthesis